MVKTSSVFLPKNRLIAFDLSSAITEILFKEFKK